MEAPGALCQLSLLSNKMPPHPMVWSQGLLCLMILLVGWAVILQVWPCAPFFQLLPLPTIVCWLGPGLSWNSGSLFLSLFLQKVFFFFFVLRLELRASWFLGMYHLSYTPQPWTLILLPAASLIAGITSLRWVLTNFWPQTGLEPQSSQSLSWVTRITGVRHHTQHLQMVFYLWLLLSIVVSGQCCKRMEVKTIKVF
jgi:hypothetical protein